MQRICDLELWPRSDVFSYPFPVRIKFMVVSIVFSLLAHSSAFADIPDVPLDRSDNRPPVLVSFSLDYSDAQAGSSLGVTLVIRDDKNKMNGFSSISILGPQGIGTLQQMEGYFSRNFNLSNNLVSRVIGADYIEETWLAKITVPSLVGQWTVYRVDFADVATNTVQFVIGKDEACSNKGRGVTEDKYSQTPCTFSKILNVTKDPSKDQLDWEAKEAKAKAEAEAKAKAVSDAQAAAQAAKDLADKPQCDERKAELANVGKSLTSYKKKNPKSSGLIDSTLSRLNNALNSKCVAEVTLSDFKRESQDLMKSSLGKSTITCVKGKLTERVTAIKPKCPIGYRKK